MTAFPPLGKSIKALMVWPVFPPSFWNFTATMNMMGYKTHLPPLGLITVAALCPEGWQLRLMDEAVEPILDADLAWADLVMVSAMEVQRAGVVEILRRARALGRRTIIGGPYASTHSDEMLKLADHVVVGEVEEAFAQIAADLEDGSAQALYRIESKPDVTQSPTPRFDLLKLEAYSMMSVQFSRGCPFQCEFCDIITICGRKPRTKDPQQILRELDLLLRLGWRHEVFIVDDNFIGNHRKALELLGELRGWQQRSGYPVPFYTEASINLASRPELMEAMVEANFYMVFIGIETPSEEALQETRKFQNLRQSLLDSVRTIQQAGLWVMGGFIMGFDSDDESIFSKQVEFIEQAAIPWAMIGILQAPRDTALHTRLQAEGRLLDSAENLNVGNFSLPNFQTKMALPKLVRGYRYVLEKLYGPRAFFQRVLRSLEVWAPRPPQQPPHHHWRIVVRSVSRSLWRQGVLSPNRIHYWTALLTILLRWRNQPYKVSHGFIALASAEHFVSHARRQVEHIGRRPEILDDGREWPSHRPLSENMAIPV